MKKKIILAVTCLAIIGFILYINITSRIVYNDEFVQGNTSGNLLNNGLFCEYNNKIYFANPNDDNSLYVMDSDCKKFKKITSHIVSHINVAGKYIFYARKSNVPNTKRDQDILRNGGQGIYRMDLNGKHIDLLCKDPVGILNLAGNYVYYQHYEATEGLTLYKVKINDRPGKQLSKHPITPAAILNGYMYYQGTERDHNIYKMNVSDETSELLYEGNCSNIIVNDDYIYFLNLENDYAITRIGLDGTNPEELVSSRVSTYNISHSGKYLYYQIDNVEESRICRMNLHTMEETTLMRGNFCDINVTSDYVFFKAFDTETMYVVPVGESNEVSQFDPPALKN